MSIETTVMRISTGETIDYDCQELKDARIAIAQDVLKQIEYQNITSGVYCSFYVSNDDILDEMKEKQGSSIQPFIDKLQPYCSVCALGSCFLSYIRLFNEVQIPSDVAKYNYFSYTSIDDIRPKLEKYFSEEQLELIEGAFEGWVGNFNNGEFKYDFDKLTNRLDSKDRLRYIMNNLIENDGTFVVESKFRVA